MQGWERGETVVPEVEVSEQGKLGKKIHRKLENLVVLRDLIKIDNYMYVHDSSIEIQCVKNG